MAMNHPIQAQLWTILMRVQIVKHWAIDLDVDSSEISRWSTGSRAMSLDDLVAVVRVCRRVGHEIAALRVVTLLVSELGGPQAPPANSSPFEVALRTGELAGDAARTMREVLADGKIDTVEADRLDEVANNLESLVHEYRSIAARARRGEP
jgi:hypothetical protein